MIIFIQSKLTTFICSDFARQSAFSFVNSSALDQLSFQPSIRLSVLTTLMGRISGGLVQPVLQISTCVISIIGITFGLLKQNTYIPFISLLSLGIIYICIYKTNQKRVNTLTSKFTTNILIYTEYAKTIASNILQIKGSQSEKTLLKSIQKHLENIFLILKKRIHSKLSKAWY